MNVLVGQLPDPLNTFSNTAQPTTFSDARHGPGGRAKGKAVGLLLKPGENSGLHHGKQASESKSQRDLNAEEEGGS